MRSNEISFIQAALLTGHIHITRSLLRFLRQLHGFNCTPSKSQQRHRPLTGNPRRRRDRRRSPAAFHSWAYKSTICSWALCLLSGADTVRGTIPRLWAFSACTRRRRPKRTRNSPRLNCAGNQSALDVASTSSRDLSVEARDT